MTALDITVEERAALMERLADLTGQVAADQYALDNLFITEGLRIISLCVVLAVLPCFLWIYAIAQSDWGERASTREFLLAAVTACVLTVAVFCVIGIMIGLPFVENSLNQGILSAEAEIEAIRGLLE